MRKLVLMIAMILTLGCAVHQPVTAEKMPPPTTVEEALPTVKEVRKEVEKTLDSIPVPSVIKSEALGILLRGLLF